MKKKLLSTIVLVTAVVVLLTACGGGNSGNTDGLSGNISLNGSTSVERVIASLIEAFREEHPNIVPTFNPTGSGAGITSAQEGTADIGLSSRALRDTETGVDAITFAIDGLAVIVHPNNPVQNLTIDQLYGIYSGTITNWNQVGGNDSPISPIGREAGSGSRGVFDDVVGVSDPAHDQELTSGGAVISAVATNPAAIGYASLSAVGSTVQIISVNGVMISDATLIDGSYPVARPFILMTQSGAELSPATQAFIDFILSPAAAEIIENAGVVQAR